MSDPRHLPLPGDRAGWRNKVVEEAAEVILACAKLERFGDQAVDPFTNRGYNNVEALQHELRDLREAMDALERLL